MTAPRSHSGATRPAATFVSKGTLVVVKVSLVGQWKEVSASPTGVVDGGGGGAQLQPRPSCLRHATRRNGRPKIISGDFSSDRPDASNCTLQVAPTIVEPNHGRSLSSKCTLLSNEY